MKKIFLTLAICVFALTTQAQDKSNNSLPYQNIESVTDLNLTTDQVAKLKKLNNEIGPQFEAIGRDRSLTGQEKGRRKRELAIKHKADIQNVLTDNQIAILEKKYGKTSSDQGLRDNISDTYDAKLSKLEKKYEQDKGTIEDNRSLSKDQKKAQKKALKEVYKTKKEQLKVEKEQAKNSVLFSE